MRTSILLCVLFVSCVAAAQDEMPETPATCKKRVGSARECFALQISFHQLICGMSREIANKKLQLGDQSGLKEAGECGSKAKAAVRPYFDVLTASLAKKPAGAASAKKAMLAFFAVMADPPGTVGLRNNLETALAELEVEVP